MQEVSLNVPSISCSICSSKISGELLGMNGIENVNVDLKTQSVSVAYDPEEIEPKDIRRKITSLGYEVIS